MININIKDNIKNINIFFYRRTRLTMTFYTKKISDTFCLCSHSKHPLLLNKLLVTHTFTDFYLRNLHVLLSWVFCPVSLLVHCPISKFYLVSLLVHQYALEVFFLWLYCSSSRIPSHFLFDTQLVIYTLFCPSRFPRNDFVFLIFLSHWIVPCFDLSILVFVFCWVIWLDF